MRLRRFIGYGLLWGSSFLFAMPGVVQKEPVSAPESEKKPEAVKKEATVAAEIQQKAEIQGLLKEASKDIEVLEMLNKANHAQNNGQLGEATASYKKICKKFPDSRKTAEAHFRLGKIYFKSQRYKDAFDELDKIIKNYPDYSKFEEVIAQQFEIASALMEGKRPRYGGLIPGFRDYDSAMEYFENIAKSAPYTTCAPKALIYKAELAQKHGKKEDAIDALDRVIDNYPKTESAAQAYLLQAELYASLVQGPDYDQGATKKAIEYFKDFLALYPDHPDVARAEKGLKAASDCLARSRLQTGNFYYYAQYNRQAALVAYNESVSAAPESDAAKKAKKHIQLIQKGVPPPKRFVDRLFSNRNRPTNEEFIDYAKLEHIAEESFEIKGSEVKTQSGKKSFAPPPPEKEQAQSFVKVPHDGISHDDEAEIAENAKDAPAKADSKKLEKKK